jgi:hypothetical protein
MSKRIFLTGAMSMALALGSLVLPSEADAAMRHGGGGHGGGFHGGGFHGGGFRGGGRYHGHGGYYRHGGYGYGGYGYGGYYGGYWCNPVQIAMGLCYY